MVQFYFLSVFLNILGGYALTIDPSKRSGSAFDGLRSTLRDPVVRLVIGILSAITGAFKLLTVIRGDVPVVGDFLPALAGLVVGATILLELHRSPEAPFRREPREAETEGARKQAPVELVTARLEKFLLDNKATVGIAGMLAGIIHFLFPMVLFL